MVSVTSALKFYSLLIVLFSNFKTLRFANCETVSVDESLIGKEAAVIANSDANYESSSWKRCSAECLRKLLPNSNCYVLSRRASLPALDYGSARNERHTPPPADSGLCFSAVN